ncbi:MAG TPA: hypothetical protein PKC18_16895 [Lacipirellulaceae bacterium]|nr:hypothetical protein [Lacipirellulaceae bacterium]HMP04787.1 hypothetical protein [Lacipirellulaceae bacterium]
MWYLYGAKRDAKSKLTATFDSEAQLLAYVRWATLESHGERQGKFEQGSALVGCQRWEKSATPQPDDDPDAVPHNPTPSML